MFAPVSTPKPPHALKARKAISYPSQSIALAEVPGAFTAPRVLNYLEIRPFGSLNAKAGAPAQA